MNRPLLTISLLVFLVFVNLACESTAAFPPPGPDTIRAALSMVALKSDDMGVDWSPRTLKFVPDSETDADTRKDLEQRGVIASFIRSDFPRRRSPDDRVHGTLVEQTLTAYASREQARDWVNNYPSLANRLGDGTQIIEPIQSIADGPGEELRYARIGARDADTDVYIVVMSRGTVVTEIAASYPKDANFTNEMFEMARKIDDRIVATTVFQ